MDKGIIYTNLAENDITSDLTLLTSNTNERQEIGKFDQIKQKYKNQTLLEIFWSDQILHVTLANRLGLSPSGLNATLKKLNDVDAKPLRENKSGKFKFYSLTEDGKNYVKAEILSVLINSEQDEENIHKIYTLLSAYKDKNQGNWIKKLKDLTSEVSEEMEDENIDIALGYEFLKEYARFYRKESKKAEIFLNLLIADKELRQKIITNIEIKHVKDKETVVDILNQWVEQDCVEVYRVMDQLFQDVIEGKSDTDSLNTCLQDAEEWLEIIQDKLLADMLRALARDWKKEQLAKEWMQINMEKHLTLYLVEQYRLLCNSILQIK